MGGCSGKLSVLRAMIQESAARRTYMLHKAEASRKILSNNVVIFTQDFSEAKKVTDAQD